jgi:hypothetical protein
MPGYMNQTLQRFAHSYPAQPEYSPHSWAVSVYGSRQQFATQDNSPALDLKDSKRVQEVPGTLVYYGRAVTTICSIATQQARATTAMMTAITKLLNYCATNPDAIVRFSASDMTLYVESDASYLSEIKARSRTAGYHYLSSRPCDITQPPSPTDTPPPMNNGPINVPCKIMREVLSSAAEAEFAGLFYNGKEAAPKRTTLKELGRPPPPTPMAMDNSTATGIANDTIKQRCSKALDMRFYWIRDLFRQGRYYIYWRSGRRH